ncbi:hypothetical protein CI1B_04630 [Bradyrhizobium ivorense]|uniref:HTH araC/xylS-type domain-containing protein n=1 Tax=Bradyrhizobium ivorense TaxID=2511166 RepID=A0A508SSJ9_9BRAD|nr:hypothetical protein CI1B_04630 [Bradyrhizobium ivorense]
MVAPALAGAGRHFLIGDGRHSMDEIASETGFADRERMRRAFLRVLGQPPQTIRRHARVAAQVTA